MKNISSRKLNKINQYAGFFSAWPFELFTTLTFDKYYGAEQIKKMRLKWTRRLCKSEHLGVAYFWSLVYIRNLPHLHLLMFGENSERKNLTHIDKRLWENRWPHHARILEIDTPFRVAFYFSKNVLTQSSQENDFGYYNGKLLKKWKMEY
jgi:hypothetical protein